MESGPSTERRDSVAAPRSISAGPAGFRSTPIPQWRTPLIGRERMVTHLTSLVLQPDVSLVNLIGSGGVGKTRLAVEVANQLAPEFRDGIVFVPLDSLQDFTLVLPTIAVAFGLSDAGEHSLEDRLVERLLSLDILLFLDNMEHVVDAVPGISYVLSRCPTLKILATSRVVLHITDEQVVHLEPLALPSAVELFVARARATNSSFTLTVDATAAVGQICARLDGLPLALELAAARTRALPPMALLSRLDQALPILTSGARDKPDRLRTMRNAIGWSYDLLSPEEQALFRRLSVFVSGFSLDAALGLAVNQRDVFETIGSLVQQSMLQWIGHGDDPVPRYQMLETVRQFGLEQLDACGEEARTRHSHASWFTGLATTAEPHLIGGEQLQWQARLETELPNIRAALTWATENDIDLAMKLAASLQQFWIVRGNLVEAQQALENVLASTGGSPSLRGRTLLAAGWIHIAQSGAPTCLQLASMALDLFRQIGDRDGIASALIAVGFSYDASGHETYDESMIESADKALVEAKTIGQQLGNRRIVALANYGLGSMALRKGEIAHASDLFSLALVDFDFCEDQRSIAWTACRIGDLAISDGDFQRAGAAFQRTLPIFASLRDWWSAVQAVFAVARLTLCMGQPHDAVLLVSAIDEFRANTGLLPSLNAGVGRSELVRVARTRLSEEEFDRAIIQGQHLTIDETITQALSLAGKAAIGEILQDTQSHGAYGLTQRESDVLRLLASGLSDREIADRLSVSPRTVGAHVTHLLAKLGVDSRTAAAVFAVRAGLD